MSRFYNAPHPILAKGTEDSIDIGGFKGIVSIDQEKNLHVESTMYHEINVALPDPDVPDQIMDFRAGAINEYLEQDFDQLARSVGNGFRAMVTHRRLFLGVLTIECNGFIEPKLFDVDPRLLEKLMIIHVARRQAHEFPSIRGAGAEGGVQFEFQGRDQRYLFPRGHTLPEILYNLLLCSGRAHGFVCNSESVANFYLAESSFSDEDSREIVPDAETLEIMEYAIDRHVVAPVAFFRFVFREAGLGEIQDWERLQRHPHVVSSRNVYTKYEDELSAEKIAQFVKADEMGNQGGQEISDEEKAALKDFLADAGDDFGL